MTTFEARAMTFVDGKLGLLNYGKMAVICLDKVPQLGLTYVQMAKEMALIKKFQALEVGGTLELNEEELTKLKAEVEAFAWFSMSDEIVGFGQYVAGLSA